ncbi:hypothetical protein H6F77_01615 [Microcoleus sp. FACHB-831]|uniref:hypothetical protein n=1 Tax=Microcoleus sp. FACHB-831 TaxID=2692827 RepID=UPI001686A95F|nr:hypothetical protein [Microcoleus sp. FACHB-831]MBD1919817.1 hypothetical protein [Microcoleus sp. FACHB-831]
MPAQNSVVGWVGVIPISFSDATLRPPPPLIPLTQGDVRNAGGARKVSVVSIEEIGITEPNID